MKLFVANCIDRHIDPVIEVFDTPEKAIEFCKEFMKANTSYPESIEENDIDGWIYHANYSCEGDHVYVTEHMLNKELA